ncbi:MAG: ubiquinone/menaquinone biosynthesis methyltransferase [Acidobacteriota bacterium]
MAARKPGKRANNGQAATRDPERVRRMFASIEPRYDLTNRLLSGGSDRYWRWVTARQLAPGPGQRSLDLACGTGDLARALTRAGGDVVAVDFTPAMLAGARARDRRRRLLLAAGDALNLPFPDQVFHTVAVAFGVRNFANLEQGLGEIHRVLRPGGRVGILEFSHPTGPLAPLIRAYIRTVMPRLGQLLSGQRGPYDYLADTIRDWPEPRRLARTLQGIGFQRVAWRRFAAGVAALHTGSRAHGG